jgi:DNA-binding HxlR family transcriptional regulator
MEALNLARTEGWNLALHPVAAPYSEASQKVLTAQLRELESEGIIERRVYPESIVRTQYTLTSHGITLRPALLQLARWVRKHPPMPGRVKQATA